MASYFQFVNRTFNYLFLGLAAVILLVYSIHVGYPPNDPSTNLGPTLARTDNVLLPLAFVPNVGQSDARTQFLAHGPGYAMFLNASGALISSRHAAQHGASAARPTSMALKMRLVDANTNAVGQGKSPLPGRIQYFIGNNPSRWHKDVPTYSSVEYRNIYPGTDLVYHGDQGRMEFDFVLAPKADPTGIRMAFYGTEKMYLNEDGDLVFESGWNGLEFKKPNAYQNIGGIRKVVDAAFVVGDHHAVGFKLGAYDHSMPLVIDPVVNYSTYVGSTGDDAATAVAIDSTGNRYITGTTKETTSDFTSVPAGEKSNFLGTSDVFVMVVNPAGNSVLYTAFIGGPDEDFANGITIDDNCNNTFNLCNVYVTGETHSSSFPGLPPLDHSIGNQDAFVFKLRNVDKDINNRDIPSGNLDYSKYLGGDDLDSGLAIVFHTDTTGDYLYVGGGTASSSGICTPAGQGDGFIAKLDAATGVLLSAKCIGGRIYDQITAIAVDSAGSVYFGGITGSTDLPASAVSGNGTPFQIFYAGSAYDGFLGKLDSDGTTLNYLTYLGGGGDDYISAIAIDTAGNAYVTGKTSSNGSNTPSGIPSPLFPTKNPFQETHAGGKFDAFVAEINSTGTDLVYSTFLGGNGDDLGLGIALDGNNEPWVVGSTTSTNLPLQTPIQLQRLGSSDGFITELSSDGSKILFSSYLGGSGDDSINGIALGQKTVSTTTTKYAFLVGMTSSVDFSSLSSFQPYVGIGKDAFLLSLTYGEDPTSLSDIAVTLDKNIGPVTVSETVTYTMTITNNGPGDATGVTVVDTTQNAVLAGLSPSQGFCNRLNQTASCVVGNISAGNSATVAVFLIPNSIGKLTNTAFFVRADQSDTTSSNDSDSKETLVVDTSGGYGGSSYLFCLLALFGIMARHVFSRG